MHWAKALCALGVIAAVDASVLTPPVIPLIVRNPYLSTWLAGARDAPWEHWPMFWTGEQLGLSIMASVPGSNSVFPLLGRAQDSLSEDDESYNISYPLYMGVSYDASVTNLTYLIPKPDDVYPMMEVTLSFLSPITPTSTLRQSIPASYVNIYVNGTFDINMYIDLNGQWVSGSRENELTWDFSETQGREQDLKTWKIKRQTEQLLTEDRDQAEWGTLHFTGPADARHESGESSHLRQRFSKTGTLQDANDGQFRRIMEKEPVFAYSMSFKLSEPSSEATDSCCASALFTIAHIQDPVVQYASARGLTFMRPLWSSWFKSTEDVLSFHYYDYENAARLASNYSQQLASDALQSGSEDYKDIVALSAREVMGATSFSGTPENPILFLKEISSNGNFQTVDVIFPAFPFFLYTNPRWLAYLLEPLIEHQLSGQYPNDYSMHDLGAHFPNATGHSDGYDEYMPVEECGDMLIMGLALVNSLKYNTKPASIWSQTNNNPEILLDSENIFPLVIDDHGIDNGWGGPILSKGEKEARKWVGKSYPLWKQWTGYLVRETLIPSNQLSTDDFAGWLANQTNLALKGIIGVRAMGQIAETLGETEDAKYYRDISDGYIKKFEGFGMSRDGTHFKLAYTWYGSWTTLYNLFADSLLCFHLPSTASTSQTLDESSVVSGHSSQQPLSAVERVASNTSRTAFIDEKIYKMQSDWYHAVRQRYGLPLDSRHLYTKSDWQFFAAAVTSKKVREEIVQSIALWVNETVTDRPLTDLYETEGEGGFPGPNFFARPVVGGHFAFLALERACEGKAVAALDFLNEEEPRHINVAASLADDYEMWAAEHHDGEL